MASMITRDSSGWVLEIRALPGQFIRETNADWGPLSVPCDLERASVWSTREEALSRCGCWSDDPNALVLCSVRTTTTIERLA